MTDSTGADRIDDLIALAVLGELSASEAAELDAALAADPASSDDLDAELTVAARLQTAHSEAPPPELKARVLAAIDHESQDPRPASSSPPPPPPQHPAAAPDGDDLASRRAARRLLRWQPLAAAAAVLVVVASGLFIASRSDDSDGRFEAVAEADDAVTRTMTGDLDGRLEVVFSPSEQALVLDGAEIPELESSETYQLWLIDGTGARSVGIFQPDDSGRVAERFDINPRDASFGVTIEPAGGSEQPTLPIVAQA